MKLLKSNLKIPALKGKRIIHGNKMFSWVDSDFKGYGLDKPEKATKAINASVYEMDKDGTFKDIFTSLSLELDSLTMTQDQILSFVEDQKEELIKEGWGNFFLLKKDEEFFVAHVDVRSGGLEVYVDRFSDDNGWPADFRHRIVVPQLALESLETSPLDSLTLDRAIAICKENGLVVTKTY